MLRINKVSLSMFHFLFRGNVIILIISVISSIRRAGRTCSVEASSGGEASSGHAGVCVVIQNIILRNCVA